MCFSATASFAASGVLTLAGVATLSQVKEKKQIPFAAIPLLFGVQQFFEGFVWLSLQDQEYARFESISTIVFLIFAQVIWPVLVPLSILFMERDRKRKILFRMFSVVGLIVGCFLGYRILQYDVKAEISDLHINYILNFPSFNLNYKGILYFVATVLPAFVSSVKWMNYFAVGILGTFLVTELFFPNHLVSVWCFFAAILSALIFFILRKQKKDSFIQ